MKLLALSIEGFRGVRKASLHFGDHDVILGPNGSGKSTIIDAMSLVFARSRLVRDLTEHDFFGSCPLPTSRIRIIATLGGFAGNDPEQHTNWFREGRAVPKWWDAATGIAKPQLSNGDQLCAQLAFGARFDVDDLEVETIRYFHDDEAIEDPFLDDAVQSVPHRLFDEIGFYVLPARRTWEGAASFASDLFRRTVASIGGIPARAVLDERDRLRDPSAPLELENGLRPLVERVNEQIARLLAGAPRFVLRVTATDSESLLRALVPHYTGSEGTALPVGRHGMGLLSLQTFILLLELGRERRRLGKPFIFAMEEPELHIPPGIQRRLVAQAVAIAEQTICTSHSPSLAACYSPTSVQVLDHREDGLASTPLLEKPLDATAANALRKLCYDERPRVVEALMHHKVMIPEGRTEFEWLRLLNEVLELGNLTFGGGTDDTPPFGAVVGVIPTHNSSVTQTYVALRRLRGGIIPIVDGDDAGDAKVQELKLVATPPPLILQWREGWTIEDFIGWVLDADAAATLPEINGHLPQECESIDALVSLFKIPSGPRRLKGDYVAYESVAGIIGRNEACRERSSAVIRALTQACLGSSDNPLLHRDDSKSTDRVEVLRIVP